MRAVDAVMPLVDEFNALDEGDKLTFLDLVDPLPEGHNHKPKKKANKKSAKPSQSSSKSPRATNLHAQLKSRASEGREAVTTIDDMTMEITERCTVVRGDGEVCELLSDHNIHHLQNYPLYHEFTTGKSAASPAPTPSPANGGTAESTQNSGTGKGIVSDVAHAGG